jgi:hypothetical protein
MEQLPKIFLEQLSKTSEQEDSITIYKGELTTNAVIQSLKDIKQAFPVLPVDFYDIFQRRIKANNFCDERLNDAVNFVIDNCVYPTPTVAQFITFDRRVKFYKYEELLKMSNENSEIWNSYKAIDIGLPKKVWFHINDIAKYNIHDTD